MIMNILEGGIKKIKTAHIAKKHAITNHFVHDFDLLGIILSDNSLATITGIYYNGDP